VEKRVRYGSVPCTETIAKRQRGTYLHDFRNGTPRLLEDVLHPFAASPRLVRDRALGELALDIGRNLARDEDVRAGLDGL